MQLSLLTHSLAKQAPALPCRRAQLAAPGLLTTKAPLFRARLFFSVMQNSPALTFGLITCCQPCLLLTHASRLLSGNVSSLLIVSGCLWLFGVLLLRCCCESLGLTEFPVLCTTVGSLSAIFYVSFSASLL